MVDVAAAERFLLANARLIERHRAAVLLHGAPVEPVLDGLRAYRHDDGGFGHALEPDVRGPHSEPAGALRALELLAELDRLDDPMVPAVADWLAAVAVDDGGIPFGMEATARYPHAPWMVPSDGGSQMTYALAGLLRRAGLASESMEAWCWERIEGGELGGYALLFGLQFLDAVDDGPRAEAAIERLRPQLDADGSVPVRGGVEGERLSALHLSGPPGSRSRALFTPEQIAAGLDELEAGQLQDGGWEFDFLHWSPGQVVEWRGIYTFDALRTLSAEERL